MKQFIKKLLRENINVNLLTPKYFINRIPFLKDYNVNALNKTNSQPVNFSFQKIKEYKDISRKIGDDIITYPRVSVTSTFTYYQHLVNENVFHNFILNNTFFYSQPKNMDDLTFKIQTLANKQMEKILSFNETIVTKENESISNFLLNETINDINGKLFKFEEFTSNLNVSLFENKYLE